MNRKVWFGIALVALVVVLGATAYTARSTTEATNGVDNPWIFETIDSTDDVGQHASVAIAPGTGKTYISYYDATNKVLKMATFIGSGGNCGPDDAWICQVVDDGSDDLNGDALNDNVGRFSSIAVSPTTKMPSIAYFDDTNNALKLAVRKPPPLQGWSIVTIKDPLIGNAGLYPSLAIDSTGRTHIAYYFSYIMGDDSLWYVKSVAAGTGVNCDHPNYTCEMRSHGDRMGMYPSLDLDSNNYPHIAFYNKYYNNLWYQYWTGSTWRGYKILDSESGMYPSLFIDTENNNRYLAHYDNVNHKLEYAKYVGADSGGNCGFHIIPNDNLWKCEDIETVTAGDPPMGISMAVDKAGNPMIAYQSGDSILKLARPSYPLGLMYGNCGPETPFSTWQCDELRKGRSGVEYGDYISLAVNSAGVPTIAYHGYSATTESNLYVAYKQFRVFLPFTLED